MKYITLVVLLIISIIGFSQTTDSINWDSDIDFLREELSLKHKNFFTVRSKVEFDNELNKVKCNIKNLTDVEIVLSLQQIVASFGDSHTRLNNSDFINRDNNLPLRLYWFKDGIYIIATTKENEAILGQKIVKINNYPIHDVCDSLSTLHAMDNKSMKKSIVPNLIYNVELLRFFDFSEDDVYKLDLETYTGIKSTYDIKPEILNEKNRVALKRDTIAYCWQNRSDLFTEKYFSNDSIYYLQYNRCLSREIMEKHGDKERAKEYPSFNDYKNTVFLKIKKNPINKFVFDMQFNGGGSSRQGTKFIKKLSKSRKINNRGKIYVIIGRRTFSSAIINTMDFKKNTDAVLVGEETGGKPNHFGEIKSFVLPSSKVSITYSTKYFKYTDEDVTTITPDVIIETSFEDYINGIDPIYEWINKAKN